MRHPTFDYTEPGAYFVTICVQDRRHAFGEVCDGEMVLSTSGEQVGAVISDLRRRFPTILVDCFVVMPNHVHVLVVLGARDLSDFETAATNRAATGERGGDPERVVGQEGAMNRAATVGLGSSRLIEPKLGEVIRTFKAVSTRVIRASGDAAFLWQSGYHDRIVRTERELAAIREYVANYSLRWELDTLNEAAPTP